MVDVYLYSGEPNPTEIIVDTNPRSTVTIVYVSQVAFDTVTHPVFVSQVNFDPFTIPRVNISYVQFDTNVVSHSIGGAVSRSHKKKLVIVEVDGKEYRLTLDSLPAFLERQKYKVKAAPVRVKEAKVTVESKPPEVVVKYAPAEYLLQVQATVDRNNEILEHIWKGIISRLQEEDDEECLLMLL